MRFSLFLTIPLWVLMGCSNAETSSNKTVADSLPKPVIRQGLDSTHKVLNENVAYVGWANMFDESEKSAQNEIYLELYFKNEASSKLPYEKIVALTDSVVHKDEELFRKRLPLELAIKYFDLRGLAQLKVYDSANKFICRANFVRVEYVEDVISSFFVAVYRTEKPIKSGSHYVTGHLSEELASVNYTTSQDTILTKNILAKLKAPIPYEALQKSGEHLKFNNSDSTLSIVNSDEHTYVVLSSKDALTVLYKSDESENFTRMLFIPILRKKLPLILMQNVAPETDSFWETLLYFDGKKYRKATFNRNF